MNELDNLLNANSYIYDTLFKIDEFCILWDTIHKAYFIDETPTTDEECKYFASLYDPLKKLLDMLRDIVVVHGNNSIRTAQAYLIRAIDALKASDNSKPQKTTRHYVTAADIVKGKAAANVNE